MQRASTIVLVVGVLLGLALAHAAEGMTVDQLRLQPTDPTPAQPVTLEVQVTLPTDGHTLFTAPVGAATDDPTAHRLDVVYWQDSLAFYPQVITGHADPVELGTFVPGSHTLTVYLHDLTSDAATREALLADPAAFTGSEEDPFASYQVTRRALNFQVTDAAATPEPTTAGLLLTAGTLLLRRRTR